MPPDARVPSVRSVYQPIVDLWDGSLVAVEALSRGGPGGGGAPAELFARAAETGTVDLLDVACLRAALRGVHQVSDPLTLFLNIEPGTLSGWSSHGLRELSELAPDHVQVVLEVTERDLLERPADLVRGLRGVREMGWGVALDDVGAAPAGVALMSFVQPDVIKLDLALVREHTTLQAAAVINAVRAEAERSGAVILAEGIETDQHLERALAMGAQLGQGWMFGGPGALVATGMRAFRCPPRPPGNSGKPPLTPFEALSAASPVRRAAVPLLASMTRQLERQALLLDEQTVVLANFQHVQVMSSRTRRRYESLAAVTALTAVTGVGMPDEPAPGVHGTALSADDPMTEEWVVTVISPHFAAALAARDVVDDRDRDRGGAAGPVSAGARRLDYVLTYDRARVLDAAGLLLEKVRAQSPPLPPPPPPVVAGDSSVRALEGLPVDDLPDLLLRAIATASNGIVIADARRPDLPLVYANTAFLRITGYPREEVLGRNCRFLQGPGTDASSVQPIRRRILAGRDVHTVLRNYRRDGTPFWNELHISAVRNDLGEITHYIGNQVDVTRRVERERRTLHLAYNDELTALPNRAHIFDHLDLELRRAERSGMSVATILLDLDGFKAVNDRFGHATGDSALAWTAHRLRSAIRAGDLLGRLGGDEFLVVLAALPPTSRARAAVDPEAAGEPTAAEEIVRRVQEHLRSALDEPYLVNGSRVTIRASSGAAIFPRDAGGPAELVARADAAMYLQKRRVGRS
ncbi:EAL domain-containing protein [Blastococcus sp. BMG 814]|uniref:EAL domain-containing protein n=1 Tax=Blastococcus carthaginiensis TaxID=3050034 RepID=A0ABT9I614_9ACTN|nr:EAL domain-containing protein [Blastococcus carthaginiensis]MDP5181011.1 EAL domain-containing protein [Blastococcus carthaginiensis]